MHEVGLSARSGRAGYRRTAAGSGCGYADGSGYDADLVCALPPAPAPATVSTPPQNLVATGQDAAVSLTWSAPSNTGGAPVTYSVQRGTTAVATGLSSTSFTDTGLTNGTTYVYTVTAVNSAGSSSPSNQASATPAAVPQSFTLSLSPSSGKAKRGGTASSTVTVAETGAAQTVVFSASGQPAGVTVTFSPSSLSGSGSSTMTVAVAKTAALGTYNIVVTASGTSPTTSTPYTLTVSR